MGLNFKIKSVKRKDIPVDELEPVRCENCGFEFKGHYCPNCGQEVAEFNRPFGFIIYDFLGNFFAFDTRFFRSFKYLLIRPGFLTSEFFRGRRMRYSPPFRIFVFLSFVLFLFLQILTERSLDAEVGLPNTEKTDSISVKNTFQGIKDSLQQKINHDVDSLKLKFGGTEEDSRTELKLDITEALFAKGNLRDKLDKMAGMLEDKLPEAKSPKERQKLLAYIAMCRNPELVISNVMKYLSWAFFLLLPLFALILKLFYIRRNQNYIRHLIFSIHLHSFLFLILIIITGLRLIFDSGLSMINGVLLLSFLVYFVLALRHFYGQSYLKAFLKFIGISAIYNVALWSAVFFVFLKSLQIV